MGSFDLFRTQRLVVAWVAERRRCGRRRGDSTDLAAAPMRHESARWKSLHAHANGRGPLRGTRLASRELRQWPSASIEGQLDVRRGCNFAARSRRRWRRLSRARCRETPSSLWRGQRSCQCQRKQYAQERNSQDQAQSEVSEKKKHFPIYWRFIWFFIKLHYHQNYKKKIKNKKKRWEVVLWISNLRQIFCAECEFFFAGIKRLIWKNDFSFNWQGNWQCALEEICTKFKQWCFKFFRRFSRFFCFQICRIYLKILLFIRFSPTNYWVDYFGCRMEKK